MPLRGVFPKLLMFFFHGQKPPWGEISMLYIRPNVCIFLLLPLYLTTYVANICLVAFIEPHRVHGSLVRDDLQFC